MQTHFTTFAYSLPFGEYLMKWGPKRINSLLLPCYVKWSIQMQQSIQRNVLLKWHSLFVHTNLKFDLNNQVSTSYNNNVQASHHDHSQCQRSGHFFSWLSLFTKKNSQLTAEIIFIGL